VAIPRERVIPNVRRFSDSHDRAIRSRGMHGSPVRGRVKGRRWAPIRAHRPPSLCRSRDKFKVLATDLRSRGDLPIGRSARAPLGISRPITRLVASLRLALRDM